MKRTVRNHRSGNRHSRDDNGTHHRFTLDEKKANKYGPMSLMDEEELEEEEDRDRDR